jgi:glutathione S-transferase
MSTPAHGQWRGLQDDQSLGYAPALELDDGSILTQGAAIVQYIAVQAPQSGSLRPTARARTKLQAWLNFMATDIQIQCFCPLFHSTTSDTAKLMYHRRLGVRLAHVDRHLSQNDYVLGTEFSVADAFAFGVLSWHGRLTSISPPIATYSYIANASARPPVRAARQAEGLT